MPNRNSNHSHIKSQMITEAKQKKILAEMENERITRLGQLNQKLNDMTVDIDIFHQNLLFFIEEHIIGKTEIKINKENYGTLLDFQQVEKEAKALHQKISSALGRGAAQAHVTKKGSLAERFKELHSLFISVKKLNMPIATETKNEGEIEAIKKDIMNCYDKSKGELDTTLKKPENIVRGNILTCLKEFNLAFSTLREKLNGNELNHNEVKVYYDEFEKAANALPSNMMKLFLEDDKAMTEGRFSEIYQSHLTNISDSLAFIKERIEVRKETIPIKMLLENSKAKTDAKFALLNNKPDKIEGLEKSMSEMYKYVGKNLEQWRTGLITKDDFQHRFTLAITNCEKEIANYPDRTLCEWFLDQCHELRVLLNTLVNKSTSKSDPKPDDNIARNSRKFVEDCKKTIEELKEQKLTDGSKISDTFTGEEYKNSSG